MSLEERLVRSMADAVIVADVSGKITLWNAGAERLFGFSECEALTQSLDIIIPEAQRKRHWDGYQKVMRTGVTRYGTQLLRVPAIRKDGSRFSLAFTVGLLKDAGGSVEGIYAVLRDDTDRWETEKSLRKQLAQIEDARAVADSTGKMPGDIQKKALPGLTLSELEKHNGREGAPSYVAADGQVYDVSSSPDWEEGEHMGLHQAGRDLTEALSTAPHGKEVFARVRTVGNLAAAAPTTSARRRIPPAWASKLIALHSHPITTHFPEAFFVFAPLFLALFYATGKTSFERTAYYLLGTGFFMAFPATATGFLHWCYKYGCRSRPVFKLKIIFSLLLLPASGLILAYHTACGALSSDSIDWAILILYFLMIPLAVLLGRMGGDIVFSGKGR